MDLFLAGCVLGQLPLQARHHLQHAFRVSSSARILRAQFPQQLAGLVDLLRPMEQLRGQLPRALLRGSHSSQPRQTVLLSAVGGAFHLRTDRFSPSMSTSVPFIGQEAVTRPAAEGR